MSITCPKKSPDANGDGDVTLGDAIDRISPPCASHDPIAAGACGKIRQGQHAAGDAFGDLSGGHDFANCMAGKGPGSCALAGIAILPGGSGVKTPLTAAKIGSKLGKSAGGASRGIRIFRNVDAAEFDSIATTKRFETAPGQMEGKWFALEGQHADQWGELLNKGQGLTVQTRIPGWLADQLHLHAGKLDGIGPAVYADADQLDLINRFGNGISLWR